MARPVKWRKIEHFPTIPYFIPSKTIADRVPENILKLEELEAIRLKDLEGFEQEECAQRMAVSRPTFQRILLTAREKIADSLINGKTIHIQGGNFTRNICPVKCMDCGKKWTEKYENIVTFKKTEYSCPSCNSNKVICDKNCKGMFCKRHCLRYDKSNG